MLLGKLILSSILLLLLSTVTAVKHMNVSKEVYNIVEEVLLTKLLTPNDTLLEKETKELFVKYLIDIALENKTSFQTTTEEDHFQVQHDPQSQNYQQIQPIDNAASTGGGIPQQQYQYATSAPQPAAVQQIPPAYPPQQVQPVASPGVAQQPFPYPYPYPYPPYPYPVPAAYPAAPEQSTRPPETLAEVDKLLQNIFRLNVTGILDQSLYLVGSNPIRNLGSGVLKLVFCDPISRLLGRCRGNDTVGKRLNLNKAEKSSNTK